MQLDVDADVVWQSASEELCLLEWREVARVRRTSLERVHVHIHRGREW